MFDGWHDEAPRAQHAAVVLAAARVQLQRGWAQQSWQGCLVGAVLRAAWWYSDRPEHAAPALDALWNGLQCSRGLGPPEPVQRVCAPAVRQARVRELTSWNDHPGRTRQEVLDLLDLTLAGLAATSV